MLFRSLILSIILQGYSAICVSEEKNKIDPVVLNAVQMLFGGIIIYLVGIGTEGFQPLTDKALGFYLSLLVLVIVSTFSFTLWFMALQIKGSKVSDINMCRLTQPVLGAILSWIMIPGEYPTFSTVAGMIIIVLSLAIYFKGHDTTKNRKKRKRKIKLEQVYRHQL